MQAQMNEKQENSNYKILVVDDSSDLLQLLETWLSESGFSVVAVNSGHEAIERFQKELFDLVLTDISMPGIDGNILAQFVHAFNEDIPVIALTASPCFTGPYFDLVLSKPHDIAGLVNSLQYVLQKTPPPDSNLNNIKRQHLLQLCGTEYGH